MARYLRVLGRAPWILVITCMSSSAVLLARPLALFAPRAHARVRAAVVRAWGTGFCHALGVRVTVRGTCPRGRFLLVSNHLSYVDIPLLAAHVDASFVAKADLSRWPLLGWAFRLAGTIFIDRGRKRDLLRVMESVARRLDAGEGVIIFPEATVGSGDGLLAFKPSLLELAARKVEPVGYATLSYRTSPGSPPTQDIVCWWDGTPFLKHFLRLLTLDGFDATLTFGREPIVDRDRKALADRLRAAMIADFEPTTASAAPEIAEPVSPLSRRTETGRERYGRHSPALPGR